MATRAIGKSSDPNITEELIATILLHDVVEDEEREIKELPFPEKIRCGVQHMSFIQAEGETKYEMKRRTYAVMPDCFEAALGKGFDRGDNLKTMPNSGFVVERIRKNIVETDVMVLPMLKQAEVRWPKASNLIRDVRVGVRDINDVLAKAYGVKLTDPNYINPSDAKDYSYLLTGETPPEEAA